MNHLPELALRARSIEELVELAEKDGCDFKNEEMLLRSLRRQWKNYVNVEFQRCYTHLPLPEELPHLEAVVKEKKCRVYGVAHEYKPSPKYLELVHQAVDSPNWLFEQHLENLFFKTSGREIIEHYANKGKVFSNMPFSVYHGFNLALLLPVMILEKITRAAIKLVKEPEEQRANNDDVEMITQVEAIALHCPPRIFNPRLPCHLDLELKERNNPANYSNLQRRSAYQAEFLRAWKADEDRNMLVGAAHSADIIYFLERGTKNQKIVDLANAHAELLAHDPKKFHALVSRISGTEIVLNNIAAFSGFAMPYAFLAYKILS